MENTNKKAPKKWRQVLESWTLVEAAAYLDGKLPRCSDDPMLKMLKRARIGVWIAERLGENAQAAMNNLSSLGVSRKNQKYCMSKWKGLQKSKKRQEEISRYRKAAEAAAAAIISKHSVPPKFTPKVELKDVGALVMVGLAVDAAEDALSAIYHKKGGQGEIPNVNDRVNKFTCLKHALNLFRKNIKNSGLASCASYKNVIIATDPTMSLFETYDDDEFFNQEDTIDVVVRQILFAAAEHASMWPNVDAHRFVSDALDHQVLIAAACFAHEQALLEIAKGTRAACLEK
ncbi:MAG: hypothetical protein IKZ87_01345 [Actinomycetaceae bacterium]|nr:hypothetical protein [Actinomycetaceae bacterium]